LKNKQNARCKPRKVPWGCQQFEKGASRAPSRFFEHNGQQFEEIRQILAKTPPPVAIEDLRFENFKKEYSKNMFQSSNRNLVKTPNTGTIVIFFLSFSIYP